MAFPAFSVADYTGDRRPRHRFSPAFCATRRDGVDFDVENISSPSVNCTVVRFREGRLAASLPGLALRAYNALASPMMRRGK